MLGYHGCPDRRARVLSHSTVGTSRARQRAVLEAPHLGRHAPPPLPQTAGSRHKLPQAAASCRCFATVGAAPLKVGPAPPSLPTHRTGHRLRPPRRHRRQNRSSAGPRAPVPATAPAPVARPRGMRPSATTRRAARSGRLASRASAWRGPPRSAACPTSCRGGRAPCWPPRAASSARQRSTRAPGSRASTSAGPRASAATPSCCGPAGSLASRSGWRCRSPGGGSRSWRRSATSWRSRAGSSRPTVGSRAGIGTRCCRGDSLRTCVASPLQDSRRPAR
mmetsp:Transcript_16851/g.58814  ORF Transcript_16851/g.58814 Transcript_16851/m.58814 type:complete len:278 (+) Transcript_16851:69-902(+)